MEWFDIILKQVDVSDHISCVRCCAEYGDTARFYAVRQAHGQVSPSSTFLFMKMILTYSLFLVRPTSHINRIAVPLRNQLSRASDQDKGENFTRCLVVTGMDVYIRHLVVPFISK